jgi:hypothetical protein
MQSLGSFSEFLKEQKNDCKGVNIIKDINEQFDYEDREGGGGSHEWDLISCGQDGSSNGYNELERFFNEKFNERDRVLLSEEKILKAMCECCHQIPHQNRTHEAFKKCVGKKLNIEID